ncbi:MAG: hypothetical protein EBR02_04510 [Alphaproteobacteria bacterium]|nr:hypothetical protein [Alphaproteobacteria bacterium]
MMTEHHHPHLQTEEAAETDYSVSRILTGIAIGAGVLGAGIILAPHILPALGVTSNAVARTAANMIHNEPMGIAGAVNSGLSLIPVIGSKLAEGGWFSAVASASVGVGGVLLGQFIESKEDGNKHIKWGNVLKYAALATSALIALPAILSSLSTGLIYLSMAMEKAKLLSYEAVQETIIPAISNTLGGAGGLYQHNMFGLNGIAAIVPHFFSCGAPFAPVALSFFQHKSKENVQTGDNITVEMLPDAPLEAGKQCTAKIRLKNERTGGYLTADDLAVVHTEKLHLLVVDESLRDYHHIHPKQTAEEGVFTTEFTPQTNHNYTAWADFTTARDGQNQRISSTMAGKINRNIQPRIDMNAQAQAGGLSCAWESNAPLKQGQYTLVHIDVRDSAGNPVNDLEPIMGAYAHLVGFSADGKTLIHAHPIGEEPTSPDDRGGPRLSFHVAPESAGETQFYLQLKRDGKEVMLPFGQRIAPPSANAEKALATRHSHAHAL